jgi:beta-aspartyl-peptidase (threonine type)
MLRGASLLLFGEPDARHRHVMHDGWRSGFEPFHTRLSDGGRAPLKPSIIVHGGAGSGKYGGDDRRFAGLLRAVEEGMSGMRSGSSLDGVVAAVSYMEESGLFNCGRGACLTTEGKVELDAAVMTGDGLAGAGVGDVTCTYRPVSLARWVMENTEHVLIVGERCRDYARLAGVRVEELAPSAAALKRFASLKADAAHARSVRLTERLDAVGTVGAVAIDADGVPAAAVSTGGRWMKLPGRVGDSAILGAGIFADTRLGAACATGTGEEIIRVALSLRACEFMKGAEAQSAARKAIAHISRARGRGTAGIITVDRKGRVGAAFNTEAMGRAWFDRSKGRAFAAV